MAPKTIITVRLGEIQEFSDAFHQKVNCWEETSVNTPTRKILVFPAAQAFYSSISFAICDSLKMEESTIFTSQYFMHEQYLYNKCPENVTTFNVLNASQQ